VGAALDARWPRLRRQLGGITAQLRGGMPVCAEDGSFGNASGTRRYRLHRPGWRYVGARPLVVMLHGCQQTSDDFGAGTRMHARGEGRGWFVLYPEQDRQANRQGCWNWFDRLHQQGDRGEPAILADMIRHITASHRIDAQRVYVAGFSAGGAMAAILAATHPELFAAVGIHSGLPHLAASSLLAAMAVMKRGPGRGVVRQPGDPRGLPTIVFHGDQDTTVHPENGAAFIERTGWPVSPGDGRGGGTRTVRGAVPGGRAWTRTLHHDAQGRCQAEHWLIHGGEHAWSGGDPLGSYTDPLGPDASREMLRFFRAHPHSLR
jgi:poly(hydroxyalkanoate) depolymerase family esterase